MLVVWKNAGVWEYWILDHYKNQLTVYDFKHEMGPEVYEIKGEVGLAMYDNEIKVNLKPIAEMIGEWA